MDEIRGTDGVAVPPYARFDFGAARKLGEHCEVAVGVINAFDPRHPEVTDSSLQPVEVGERMWYVRFQANF